jgi:predicted enzyme related to lactoylglutathione lyase
MAHRGYRSEMADYLVLTLDVDDLDLQTAFWCGALGYEPRGDAGQFRAISDATGAGPRMLLQRVDDVKVGKNRLHIDIHVADVEAEAARLEGLGATITGRVAEHGLQWVVLADPEGNEFCIVPS